jgi:integration host factor subunit beta
MVRAELIRRIAGANPQLPLATCKAIADTFFDTMSDHLARHGRIELRGFASFSVMPPSGGHKHNPRTGEPVDEATLARIRFRPSSVLAQAIASE